MKKAPIQIRRMNDFLSTNSPKQLAKLREVDTLQRATEMEIAPPFRNVLCDIAVRIVVSTHGLAQFDFFQIEQMPSSTIFCVEGAARPCKSRGSRRIHGRQYLLGSESRPLAEPRSQSQTTYDRQAN